MPVEMTNAGTLNILGEIQALVVDKLQAVNYKWLSRNFLVSSNDAKRMLQEFVEQNGNGLAVVYTLSGWLKDSPPVYHIKLVSGTKLTEAKEEFKDNCSIHVYSVQACIPKDPAELWNAEFVQAAELFDQPPAVENCLRDNRFCGVLNSSVQRSANGSFGGVAPIQSKNAGLAVSSKSTIAVRTPIIPQPQGKVQLSSPKIEKSASVVSPVVKSEKNASAFSGQTAKAPKAVEKVAKISANNKKVQNGKSSSGSGGSLASLWGRAPVKSEPICPPSETPEVVSKPIATAEVQICALESADAVSSDDDVQHVNHRKASNGGGHRKRKVFLESSDDEDDCENAVKLASPDPPEQPSSKEAEHKYKTLAVEKNKLEFEPHKGGLHKIKEEKALEKEATLPTKKDVAISSKCKVTGIALSVKTHTPEASNLKDKAKEPTSTSPKRRKVLKTRIDERGMEVTEVVWEGEEMESKNTDKKSISTDVADNRPPVIKKSPAFGSNATANPGSKNGATANPVSKNGAKKKGKGADTKDPKQGGILSFFKKA